jgi:uncharacterized protein (DUF983 family)
MTDALPTNDLPQTKWVAFRRGAKLRCPRCNQEKLFRAYLKPVEACPNCGKDWENVRADLAPAWASMTLSAHVIIVIYHFFFFDKPIANWLAITIMVAMATAICLATLPSFKGLFMAIVWWNKMEKEQQS